MQFHLQHIQIQFFNENTYQFFRHNHLCLLQSCKTQSTFSCYVTLVSFLFNLSEQRVYRINLQVASRMLKRLNQQLRQPQLPQSCMPKPKHQLEHIPYLLTWIPSEDVLHWYTLSAISIPVHVAR